MITKSWDYYFCRNCHRLLSSSEEAQRHQADTNHQTVKLIEERNETQSQRQSPKHEGSGKGAIVDYDNAILASMSGRMVQPDDILKLNEGIQAVAIHGRGEKTLLGSKPSFVVPQILTSGGFALWIEEFFLAFSEEFVPVTKGHFSSVVMLYRDVVVAIYRQKNRTIAVITKRGAWSSQLHDALEKTIS